MRMRKGEQMVGMFFVCFLLYQSYLKLYTSEGVLRREEWGGGGEVIVVFVCVFFTCV